MTKRNRIKIILSFTFLLLTIILLICATKITGFGEWYAIRIYPIITNIFGRFFGVFPFSVVEIGLYAALFILLGCGVNTVVQAVVKKRGRQPVISYLTGLLLGVTILLFLYEANCGVNYHRTSFSEETGLVTSSYTVEDLKQVCDWLTKEVNRYGEEVNRDSDQRMLLEDGQTKQEAVETMENLGKRYPELAGDYPEPKAILISDILSYQELTGVYSPFTIEANYNAGMPDDNIPFTMCHELSHLRGFMQEEEANFIAFLACEGSKEIDFLYSGYLMAWTYSMNALRRADEETWEQVRADLSEAVEQDVAFNSGYWRQYRGTVSEVTTQVNDAYLKANGQQDGVKSYDRMVDLLVTYYQETQN